MTAQTRKSFVVACKQYFGFLPGQSLMEFRDEIRKLTPEDREELASMLSEALGELVDSGIPAKE